MANPLSVASMIHGSIQNTHAWYEECTSFMLYKVANGSSLLVVATHNLESGMKSLNYYFNPVTVTLLDLILTL